MCSRLCTDNECQTNSLLSLLPNGDVQTKEKSGHILLGGRPDPPPPSGNHLNTCHFYHLAKWVRIRCPPWISTVGPVLPCPGRSNQWSPPLYDFPNMLKSVSTKCVETCCLYRGLEAISYRARDRALWKRANSLRS